MISIIIPTYNRIELLLETLQKLFQLKTTIIYEVIVVNDGVDLPFIPAHPLCNYYKNPGKGVACARNYGASFAKYELLFFIDDDMWITEENLQSIVTLYKKSLFNENVIILNWQYPDTLINEMSSSKIGRYLLHSNYHTLEGRCHTNFPVNAEFVERDIVGSGSFVIAKDLFEKAGKYNENFTFQGEDLDFSLRLKSINALILIYTKTICYHNQKDRLSLEGFINREERGYNSQFADKRFIPNIPFNKRLYYTIILPFKGILFSFFYLIPNMKIFDFISFKIIGILSSLAFYTSFKRNKTRHD